MYSKVKRCCMGSNLLEKYHQVDEIGLNLLHLFTWPQSKSVTPIVQQEAKPQEHSALIVQMLHPNRYLKSSFPIISIGSLQNWARLCKKLRKLLEKFDHTVTTTEDASSSSHTDSKWQVRHLQNWVHIQHFTMTICKPQCGYDNSYRWINWSKATKNSLLTDLILSKRTKVSSQLRQIILANTKLRFSFKQWSETRAVMWSDYTNIYILAALGLHNFYSLNQLVKEMDGSENTHLSFVSRKSCERVNPAGHSISSLSPWLSSLSPPAEPPLLNLLKT